MKLTEFEYVSTVLMGSTRLFMDCSKEVLEKKAKLACDAAEALFKEWAARKRVHVDVAQGELFPTPDHDGKQF